VARNPSRPPRAAAHRARWCEAGAARARRPRRPRRAAAGARHRLLDDALLQFDLRRTATCCQPQPPSRLHEGHGGAWRSGTVRSPRAADLERSRPLVDIATRTRSPGRRRARDHAPVGRSPRPSPAATTRSIVRSIGAGRWGERSRALDPAVPSMPWVIPPLSLRPCCRPTSRLGTSARPTDRRRRRHPVDVMNGQFVRTSPSARRHRPPLALQRLPFEAHLMVRRPTCSRAVRRRRTVSASSSTPSRTLHLHRTLGHVRSLGRDRWRALNPATPAAPSRTSSTRRSSCWS